MVRRPGVSEEEFSRGRPLLFSESGLSRNAELGDCSGLQAVGSLAALAGSRGGEASSAKTSSALAEPSGTRAVQAVRPGRWDGKPENARRAGHVARPDLSRTSKKMEKYKKERS